MKGQQEIFRTSRLMSNKNFQTTKKTVLRNCFLMFVMSFLINTEVLAHQGHSHHDLRLNPDREFLNTASFFPAVAFTATGKANLSELAPTTNEVGQERYQLNFQGVN